MPFLPSFRSVGAKSVKSGFMAFLALGTIVTASGQALVSLDFQTEGQFDDNFRITLTGNLDYGQNPAGYVYQAKTGGSTNPVTAIYDTTPGSATDPLPTFGGPISVSFDISAANANSSFGVFLLNPNSPNTNLLALFNLDSSGNTDRMRFVANTNLTGNSIGLAIGTGNDVTGNSGLNFSPDASPIWGLLTVVYTPGATETSDTLSLTVGNFSHTVTVSGTQRLTVDPAVALRINDTDSTAGSAKLTNFQIAAIPEPSTLLLLGAGALGLFLLRKRK